MKTFNENPIKPMEDQPAKPVYIHEQHNSNCQQFYGPVTGCVFAMPGAVVNQYPTEGTAKAARSESSAENATRNQQLEVETIKRDILDYVMQLHPLYVSKEWQDRYEGLWKAVLELPEVKVPKKKGLNNDIYDKGNLKNTTFNRDLVAKILNLMAERKVLNTTCAKRLYEALEGDKNRSVYNALAYMPAREVMFAVDELIKKNKKSLLDVHQ